MDEAPDAAAKDKTPLTTPPQKLPKPAPETEREVGGPKGPEPTRYGDWEINGRCTDF